MNYRWLRKRALSAFHRTLDTILGALPHSRISPNTITGLTLPLSFAAAAFFGSGHTFLGGLFLLISGIMDSFDGSIARMTHKVSKFGAQLDSNLDRYVEFVVFLGILNYYRTDWIFFVVFLAMVGSIMVSYAGARAGSLGVRKVVGLMQRPERIILLAMGAILSALVSLLYGTDIVFRIAIILLAVLSNATAVHRIIIVKQEEESGSLS